MSSGLLSATLWFMGWLPCSRARSYIEAVGGVEAVVGDDARVFKGTRRICWVIPDPRGRLPPALPPVPRHNGLLKHLG